MPFEELTPKQRRTVDTDVKTLFTIRGLLTGQTIEQLQSLDFFHPWLETKKGSFPLSDAGVAARRRIRELFAKLSELNAKASAQELANAISESHKECLNEALSPLAKNSRLT